MKSIFAGVLKSVNCRHLENSVANYTSTKGHVIDNLEMQEILKYSKSGVLIDVWLRSWQSHPSCKMGFQMMCDFRRLEATIFRPVQASFHT